MKEHGILFTGEMVRAVLAGSKTQTRRVMKPQAFDFVGGDGIRFTNGTLAPRMPVRLRERDGMLVEIRCPYGYPGDRLWVRETWGWIGEHHHQDHRSIMWRATHGDSRPNGGRWRPSIHMPRWASRITLEVTDVRVERVQDISEEDAIAEGIQWRDAGLNKWGNPLPGWSWRDPHPVDVSPEKGWERCLGTARNGFGNLWNQVAPDGLRWADNPWVWVVSFRRIGE